MTGTRTPPPRLATSTLLAYGAPAVVLAALGLTFYVYLPKFYADWVGIDLALIGFIALASRLWDAVTDPTIGFLSDRTRTPMGRRRPWMILSAAPLGVVFYLLLSPPAGAGPDATVRFVVLAFLFFLFWTTVAVPYESLGAEISFDYDERNRLFGVREGSVLVGTLLGSALPAAFVQGTLADAAAGFRFLGAVYGAAGVALIVVCVVWVKETRAFAAVANLGEAVGRHFPLRRNKPFVVLQVAYTIYALGGALAATMFLFYVEHVLFSRFGPLFLALYLGLGAICLPAWVKLATVWEKRTAWLAALGINTSAFAGVWFLGPGDGAVFAVLVAISALGLGGTLAIPPSMQADVIDYDEWKTGRRREGRFIGMWALAKKLAMAMAAGLALPILDWAGYASGTQAQTPSTVAALKGLYVGGPVLCNLTAMAIAWHYTIDRAHHQRLRAEIDARPAPGAGETAP